ncbi:MAG: histidinol-phosphate aminotransferase family protein [Candidatus Omnitrophica bacterium]|nr:histidinol-phosphate aminotransferase family protein [Candidatus Omnitrophota bacterium]
MKKNFKSHIQEMKRYQTSLGRDLEDGCRLDRNEKVSNFSDEVMSDIFNQFQNYSLSASPESEPLYEKIADTLSVNQNQLYVTCGITEGIKVLYETLTEPGDNVIVLDPTYPIYMVYARLYQLDYRKFQYGTDCKPDLKTLYDNIDDRTRVVVIPNPNLPIESIVLAEEMNAIAKKCQEVGAFLVIDEAYYFFGAPTMMDLVDKYDNVIVFRTFSKAYGLAAIRLGFMVSQSDNIEYFTNTRSLVESNTLSMTIARYFLDHPELRDQHVKEVNEGGKYLQEELTSLGIRWHGGHVTNGILIFLESKQQADDAVQYMREKKIYIRGAFEEPYHTCIRISLGPKTIMNKFIDELKIWQKNQAVNSANVQQ